MQSNYRRLGDYIRKVDKRNTDLKVSKLLGLSMEKEFRETTSNIIGTDMSVYKVMNQWQFACDFMSVIRVYKLPVVLKTDVEPNLVSPAYPVFEVNDMNVLDPEYLMMWLRRPEFDRYAFFKCDSAIRGGFDWEELCDTTLPVPPITKQRQIVKEYNTIVDRINLNNLLIKNLEEAARAIYKQWFVEFDFPDKSGQPYKSNGGVMEFNKELEREIPKGWEARTLKSICTKIGSGATPRGGKGSYHKEGISLIRSLNVHDFIFSSEALAFIDGKQAKDLQNVIVEEDDILFNITGVSVARCCKVPSFILPARVNQHVMIIRPEKQYFISQYLLCLLCHSDNKAKLLGISQSGSTREAITKAEIEDFQVLLPSKETAKDFDKKVRVLIKMIENKTFQNDKLFGLKDLMLAKLAKMEG